MFNYIWEVCFTAVWSLGEFSPTPPLRRLAATVTLI